MRKAIQTRMSQGEKERLPGLNFYFVYSLQRFLFWKNKAFQFLFLYLILPYCLCNTIIIFKLFRGWVNHFIAICDY